MYVILVNDDNTLTTTRKQRIMQRSKLFDALWFLVFPTYNEHEIAGCTTLLEYILPVSRKYCSEILTLSEEKYNGYLKYVLPVDTELTAEAGNIELQISFVYTDLDASGNSIQRVRKTSTTSIEIVPISAWSDIIPDCALAALDQRIIKIDSQIKAINDINSMISDTKADNIKYDSDGNTLQLMSGKKEIGDKVTLNFDKNILEDGIPIVDFNSVDDDDFEEDPDGNTVVEF